MNTQKQCCKCLQHKTLNNFNSNKTSSDKLHSYCRDCVSYYNRTRSKIPKDELKEMMKEKKENTKKNRELTIRKTKESKRDKYLKDLLHILADEDFKGQYKYVPFNEDKIALSDGRIWTLSRGKFMGEYNHRDGYLFSGKYREEHNGPKKLQLVHRVIAMAFLTLPECPTSPDNSETPSAPTAKFQSDSCPIPEQKKRVSITSDQWEIDHRDGNKHNNSIHNLHFVTRKENMTLARDNGLMNTKELKRVNQYDTDGTLIKEWESVREIVNNLKCNRGSLYSAVIRGNIHMGFLWKWKEN